MDIITAATDVSPASNHASKSPEVDLKRIISIHKPLSFTNGVLKRHRHLINPPPPPPVSYKECLKNHAAALGGHALDGCGEFMPSPSTNPNLPTSLKCAVCGCHRNFHHRDPEDSSPNLKLLAPPPPARHVIHCQTHHRHHPPQPLPSARATSPNPSSPPPISSSYYPSSAPHMLLALSSGLQRQENLQQAALGVVASNLVSGSRGRKRFRTKFSNVQREKMYEFAESIGWRMHKRDEELVNHFCNEVGVRRGVFNVWMHNNKSTIGKRSSSVNAGGCNNNGFLHSGIHHHHDEDVNNGEVNAQQKQHTLHSLLNHSNLNGMNGDDNMIQHHHHLHHHSEGSGGNVTTNGSSSSS